MYDYYKGSYNTNIKSFKVSNDVDVILKQSGKVFVRVSNLMFEYIDLCIRDMSAQMVFIVIKHNDTLLEIEINPSLLNDLTLFLIECKSESLAIEQKIKQDFLPWLTCFTKFVTDEYDLNDFHDKHIFSAKNGIIVLKVNRYTTLDVFAIEKRYRKLGYKNGIMHDNIIYKMMDVKFGWNGGAPK